MNFRPVPVFGALIIVAVASLGLAPLAFAQSAEGSSSQTPWGDPDLQGVWASDPLPQHHWSARRRSPVEKLSPMKRWRC